MNALCHHYDEHAGAAITLELAAALSWKYLALVSVVCGDLTMVVLLVVSIVRLAAFPWL